MWEAFMAELRNVHLGTAAPERSVVAELQAAFEAVVAARRAQAIVARHATPGPSVVDELIAERRAEAARE